MEWLLMGKKAKDSDKLVNDLIAKVKERREKVGALKKPQWITPCSLVLPGMERLNVQVEQDLGKLAVACGILLRMKQDIEAASKELEVEIEPKWQNYAIDDWVSDIKLRVRITNIKAEQERLATLEAKLNKLMSPEQRRAMELAAIEAELE
jgi:hypothetical protein